MKQWLGDKFGTGESRAHAQTRVRVAAILCAAALCTAAGGSVRAWAQEPDALTASQAPVGEMRHGREQMQAHDFVGAQRTFAAFLQSHPKDAQAQLGLGDAQLGLHQNEAAEATYRALTAQQPELWQAHKNLVVVEAALGRWEDFDRERTVLRLARERGAPGISPRESDVIDTFSVRGEPWVVRAYFEPLGRSRALYNFERFSPEGRVEAYVSLEDEGAARSALRPQDLHIGAPNKDDSSRSAPGKGSPQAARPPVLALNWYTRNAHGSVARYPGATPSYVRVRKDVIRWLRSHPEQIR